MVQKLLVLSSNNQPENYTPIVVSGGASDAGKPIATGPDGKLDNTFLQVLEEINYIAKEAIAQGAFVNVVNVTGTAEVQNAIATDATKLAVGWSQASLGMNDPGNINFAGVNPYVPLGAFTAANIGEEVFLDVSAGGVVSRSHAFVAGNAVQKLGTIVAVDVVHSTMSVVFQPEFRAIA
jgi:hypothetical protein